MVVMGNPPYSGHSANNGTWISSLLKGKDTITEKVTSNYFEVDGKPLGEKNPKWLNDDYVKFIRFAQWRIEQTGYGILAFITNHGFLDNPTFRGMRQSLMATFDDIYILDLHGNSKKKEQSPDGSKDENVFDIQQGVAISIFVKRQNDKKQAANIYHTDLYGLRDNKYGWLNSNSIDTTEWIQLNPQAPFYLFVRQNTDLLAEYEPGWKVTDIFPVNSVGIVTARDELTIQWSREEIWKTVIDFADLLPETARLKYRLGEDARDWKVELAQKDLRSHPYLATKESKPFRELLAPILYRPFDIRYTYYTGKSRGFHCMPRGEVMRHMLAGENLGLISCRQQSQQSDWSLCGVTNSIIESCVVSNKTKEINYLFPLYLYPNPNNPKELEEPVRPNLSPAFLKDITAKLGYTPTPETIFYYIYAIFHSPTYRTRYAEFLKIDFPRVPLTSNNQLFTQLAEYGEELVALHLMKSPKLNNPITQFVKNNGNQIVDAGHPKYTNGAVIINRKGDKFTGVPESVWNFYVGGYQVCQKWLKDRKGRQLSDEDIQHYQGIVVALQETIKLMDKIDQAIPGFPIQ
ncbi:MAG: type ISP restriction/modification enzyme [Gloeotrichia echinulata DVL01]